MFDIAWISKAALFIGIAVLGGNLWCYHQKTAKLQTLLKEKKQELQQAYTELEDSVTSHQEELKHAQMALEQ